MFAALECQDDTVLLCRRDACKHIDLLDYVGERCIGHMIQVVAQNDSAAILTDLCSYSAIDAIHRFALADDFVRGTVGKHTFWRALCNQQEFVLVSHDHREAAPFKVEWNLTSLAISSNIYTAML